jgi:hypothetical protein
MRLLRVRFRRICWSRLSPRQIRQTTSNLSECAAEQIRRDLGSDIGAHGSDAVATARVETPYFFDATAIQGRVEVFPDSRLAELAYGLGVRSSH